MNLDQVKQAALLVDQRHLEPVSDQVVRDTNRPTYLRHLRWMCKEIQGGMEVSKANRWLGFVQGVLVGVYHIPLDEMKSLNSQVLGEAETTH